MRKFRLVSLALILAVLTLAAAALPAAAAPGDKQPVAWVESKVNTANDTMPGVKTMHELSAKLFADGSIKGGYQVHDFLAGTKAWAVDNPYYPAFGREGTFEFAYFWYDDATGARMADLALYVHMEGLPPQYPAALARIRIADYGQGQSSALDWHTWWSWEYSPADGWHWEPSLGDMIIPYFHGNAHIQGDLTFTGPPPDLATLP